MRERNITSSLSLSVSVCRELVRSFVYIIWMDAYDFLYPSTVGERVLEVGWMDEERGRQTGHVYH
jgi:hypothetical protein